MSNRLLLAVFAEICPACLRKFVVPFLPESLYKRLTHKFVQPDALCFAKGAGAFAYLPFVIVDGGEGRVLGKAQRIQVA